MTARRTRPSVKRFYLAKKGKNEETIARANTIEALSVKIRELGIDPRSVVIESVPESPLTRRMGLRITGRKSEISGVERRIINRVVNRPCI